LVTKLHRIYHTRRRHIAEKNPFKMVATVV